MLLLAAHEAGVVAVAAQKFLFTEIERCSFLPDTDVLSYTKLVLVVLRFKLIEGELHVYSSNYGESTSYL